MTTEEATGIWIEFRVDGTPKPQGSKRAFVNPKTKRAIIVDDNKVELRDWRTDVKLMARKAMRDHPMIVQPSAVVLGVAFVMPRPLSTPKSRTPPAIKKPDIDKLLRAIMDALSGTVYQDDAQVIGFDKLDKRIAEIGESPGATITVTEILP